MFKLTRKIFSLIFTVSLIVLIIGYLVYQKLNENYFSNKSSGERARVIRVVDGDTFEIENKIKIRLIGIDTPEKYESNKLDRDSENNGIDKKTIQKLGKLASNYAKNLVEGKEVIIERDPINDDKDKYGRLLRYVYLDDGTCVNAKLIEDGYANAYTKYPFSKSDEFRKLERNARENNRGLWGPVDGLKQFK